ncbi:MAG TPA: NADH-cytochrome b5 reductase, partial [bacterium]|nr:NADH-cytochrome b5 reductase [bacterium]
DKLRNLKIGDEVSLKGPLGNCVLAPNHNEIVFLIGGIGVTPCISMLLDLANNNFSDYEINIFYANRNEQEIAFKNEFDELVKKYPRNLRIFHILSECNISDFDCIVGMIREDVIAQKIKDIHSKYFYIFGPPAMVNAMKGVCNNLGCPKDKVISESFIGY